MSRFFFNLGLKTKIIIVIFLITSLVAITLGYYSIKISRTQIIEKVSASNLSITEVIENNISRMQQSISDWVTIFTLSSVVQKGLQETAADPNNLESVLYSGATASVMGQMLVTGDMDYLALYGNASNPLYQIATDDSSGPVNLDIIRKTEIFKQTLKLNGASYWFPLSEQNNTFIEYNRMEKIGMSRMIRNTINGKKIGFIFVGMNYQTIRNHYLKNLFDDDRGILILDQQGYPLLTAGKEFYNPDQDLEFYRDSKSKGSKIVTINGEELLVTYSKMKNGWLIVYAVPINFLTKELDSIRTLVFLIIVSCLLFSIPLAMLLSSFLTAPIKELLGSMRRFQNGHFEEKVVVKYHDEIGMLSQGYNTMVTNIKSLIDESNILQLKEKDAELKALQSQINPHFLYNMLDMIFWEAEKAGQEQISEMIISLSRLFRLSLNRGKSFTNLGKEKELLQHYLNLQQMRFKDKLSYQINISNSLNQYVILKLCLQPFIENALIHGVESKSERGYVNISGVLENGYLHFTIEDNGRGMDNETLKEITKIKKESDVYTSQEISGYAIQNVIQRLLHYYEGDFVLSYSSEPGRGTKVDLIIPAIEETQEESS